MDITLDDENALMDLVSTVYSSPASPHHGSNSGSGSGGSSGSSKVVVVGAKVFDPLGPIRELGVGEAFPAGA